MEEDKTPKRKYNDWAQVTALLIICATVVALCWIGKVWIG